MNKRVLLSAVVLIGFAFAACVFAADANQTKGPITIKGKVHVNKDKNGNIESVEIKTPKTYHVTLDAKGQEIGNTMKGEKIEATGTETVRNHEKWITVDTYKKP